MCHDNYIPSRLVFPDSLRVRMTTLWCDYDGYPILLFTVLYVGSLCSYSFSLAKPSLLSNLYTNYLLVAQVTYQLFFRTFRVLLIAVVCNTPRTAFAADAICLFKLYTLDSCFFCSWDHDELSMTYPLLFFLHTSVILLFSLIYLSITGVYCNVCTMKKSFLYPFYTLSGFCLHPFSVTLNVITIHVP